MLCHHKPRSDGVGLEKVTSQSNLWTPAEPSSFLMLTVRAIKLVLPEIEVHLAGSSIDGQLVLDLRSTLVDPVVKVELVGRGLLVWPEEYNPEWDYDKSTNQAVCIFKAMNFPIEGKTLERGTG